jgi:hypothetical protein
MTTNINTGHSGARRKAQAGRKPAKPTQAPVTVTRHDTGALKLAQELAKGRDVHVIGNPDGTISIVNGR